MQIIGLIVSVITILVAVAGGWYLVPRLTAARAARVTALGVRREIERIDVRVQRARESGRIWDTRAVGLPYTIWDRDAASLRAVLAVEEYDFVARFYELVQRTDRLVKADPKITARHLDDDLRIIHSLSSGALDAIRWCSGKRIWSYLIRNRRVPLCLAPTPMSRLCKTCGHPAATHEQAHLLRWGRVHQIERFAHCTLCACHGFVDPMNPYAWMTRRRIALRYRLGRKDVRRLRKKERPVDETMTFLREAD
jgi:hypothetical protein